MGNSSKDAKCAMAFEAPIEPFNKTGAHPLYSAPLRKPVIISLSLVVFWNTTLLILCCIAGGTTYYTRTELAPFEYVDRYYETEKPIIFLFWAIIPIVIWVNSSVELYTRWRRTLGPLRIVITSAVSLFLWLLAVGYWTPCLFRFGSLRNKNYENSPYCTFPGGAIVVRDSSAYIHTAVVPIYWVFPWVVIPALIL